MNNPKISVIVPVYKAENYLHCCVDSLLAQTFTDFEILLIDDGSPDRSGEICDEYARMDSRIRVFHKDNGGVSSARQCGIDHAKGEYTIHADPDDWVEPMMLEELYKKAKEEDADMVICDFYIDFLKEKKYVIQQPQSLKAENVLTELFQTLHGSLWNKLIKSNCYRDYNLTFPIGLNYCEDVSILLQLLVYDIHICYLSRAFYHYDQIVNQESYTRKITPKLIKQMFLLVEMVGDYLKGHNHCDMIVFRLKLQTKIYVWLSNSYTYADWRSLYPETEKYIKGNWRKNEMFFFTKYSLKGRAISRLMFFLRSISLNSYMKIKYIRFKYIK